MTTIERTAPATPDEYLAQLEEPRQSQVRQLHDLIRATVPNLTPYMQSGMIGYGAYHYRYASGREGDWVLIALASQKRYISLYVCATKDGQYVAEAYRSRLPKADIGKSCIRFKRPEDLDPDTLRQLLRDAEAFGIS